jgi:radical SAM protein with 4Fe4S-binding SPASM domain
MTTIEKKAADIYQKQHSFEAFQSKNVSTLEEQKSRVMGILAAVNQQRLELNSKTRHLTGVTDILRQAENDLLGSGRFKVTQFIAEELATIDDADIPRYVFHRYRYDVFPLEKKLDEFPPYLQIEPSSICNFKCVFCYQTDPTYNSKQSGHLGTMTAETFKRIVDQIEGQVEFISLASRGEPLVAKELPEMLAYTEGKFLGLKINTNASLLNEKMAHAILSSGIKTVVFSADAAEEPLYSKLRVNGSLDKTVRNIDLFENIRSNHYKNKKIITRVSGVKVSEHQSLDAMVSFWGQRVDQVAFVKYNPWENIYQAQPNGMETPCSDLWRRMFVWYDGKVNPCDSDYKSSLALGNALNDSVSDIWSGAKYNELRKMHATSQRQCVEPCKRCYVV